MNKEILRLAIPNILSNVSVPLMGTVDVILMAHLTNLHLGAVGLGTMIFNFIFWNFGFLRMGTTGITAQFHGEQNQSEIILTLARALAVALCIATLLLLIMQPFQSIAFELMNVQAEQYDLVATYFQTRIWAAPATLGLMAMMGWFFGMQNSIYPLIITIVVNVVNIMISSHLVVNLGMDVDGAALGTVIAQYVGFALAIIIFLISYRDTLKALIPKAILQWQELSRFLNINKDIFIRTLCLTLAFSFFYSQSSKLGVVILAANTILMQFLNWMSYAVDGFAFAAESLVGKYKGARDIKATHRAIRVAFIWGMVMAVLFSLLYGIFGSQLAELFAEEPSEVASVLPYLFWMVLFPILATPCYIWDGVFIGLTASKSMRNLMIVAFVLFAAAYLLGQPYGNHGLWMALLVFMVARGGLQWWWYARKGLDMQ